MLPYRTPNMSDEEWERQQYAASFGDTFSDPEKLRRRNEAIAKWKPGTPVFGGEKETREPGRGGLVSIEPWQRRQTGEREGGLSNLFSVMPEGYEEMIMAQRKEAEDLFSSYGKDPQDPSAHPMSGGRFTKEFMDYAKSKGYDIKDMTSVDGGMHLTKKEWDTEKKQKFPQFHTFLGEPGVMPISKPLMPDRHTRPPPAPDYPQPPVMPTPQPPVMPPQPPVIPNWQRRRPGHEIQAELAGKPSIPKPDPSLNPFQPPVQLPEPPSPPVSPRPEPKPGIHFPQLPTGQKVSNFLDPENPGLNPPSIRLKHGGSLTDKVLHILRNLS